MMRCKEAFLELAQDKLLGRAELRVFILIACLADENGVARCSQNQFRRLLGYSRGHASDIFGKLADRGYLKVWGQIGRSKVYQVHEKYQFGHPKEAIAIIPSADCNQR